MIVICSLILPQPLDQRHGQPHRRFHTLGPASRRSGQSPLPRPQLPVRTKYNALGEQVVTDTLFPVGETTHTDWAGAVLNAQTVIDGLKKIDHCPIVDALLPTPPTNLKNPTGKPR